MPRLSTKPKEPIRPPLTVREEYDGNRHILDCQTNLSIEQYDDRCLRCSKIKKVISLRRKQTKYGATLHEARIAHELAQKIINDYELTRGETFDKKYQDISIPPRPAPRRPKNEKSSEDFDTI